MVLTELDDYFQGDVDSDVRFKLKDWIKIQKDLITAEAILKNYGQKNGWEFKDYLPKCWPSKRILKKKNTKVYEIRCSLNFQYFIDNEITYTIDKSKYRQIGNITIGIPKFETVSKLTSEEINDIQNISEEIHKITSQLFL